MQNVFSNLANEDQFYNRKTHSRSHREWNAQFCGIHQQLVMQTSRIGAFDPEMPCMLNWSPDGSQSFRAL